MDTHSTSQTRDMATQKTTGCCCGKADPQPRAKAKAEPCIAHDAEGKPAISDGCSGQN